MSTSALDLIGVLLIGLVGALAVTTIQSQPPPEVVGRVAELLGVGELSDQTLVLLFAGAAAFVLLTKSVVSSYLTRRVFVFLANRQALVSARLVEALLSRPLTFIQRRSSQETAYALIAGAGAATSQILGQLVIAATEAALLIVLGTALLILNPAVAIGSIVFFAFVALLLQRAMGAWSARVGTIAAQAEISSMNAIQEALASYREIIVSNRRSDYVDRIQQLRWRAASVAADVQFISLFPKYMFEAALVVGGFLLAGVLFATQDSIAAIGTLALFLAAGTRVMPSLLRLQSAALTLRGAAGSAGPTFTLAAELESPSTPLPTSVAVAESRTVESAFSPRVQLRSIWVRYPDAPDSALKDISLDVAPGTSLALVGLSGSGKSTLADVLLGVLEPDTGVALIGGLPPAIAISTWPGGVGYVPQDVALANGTVRENVALGLPDDEIDDDLVRQALERAHLATLLGDHRDGIWTEVGERGVRLSGGQRQRLGIARALYTEPKLLVLDEATSALDAETEEAITRTIAELEGEVTTVVIAHRLSTVRFLDQISYLDGGALLASGSFEDVASQVPSFKMQAKLMGLM